MRAYEGYLTFQLCKLTEACTGARQRKLFEMCCVAGECRCQIAEAASAVRSIQGVSAVGVIQDVEPTAVGLPPYHFRRVVVYLYASTVRPRPD